jgi:hypothetical protein
MLQSFLLTGGCIEAPHFLEDRPTAYLDVRLVGGQRCRKDSLILLSGRKACFLICLRYLSSFQLVVTS